MGLEHKLVTLLVLTACAAHARISDSRLNWLLNPSQDVGQGNGGRDLEASPLQVTEVTNWPRDASLFDRVGQVSGVAVCPEGRLHMFVRRNVVWDGTSFDLNNNYKKRDQGPIVNDTVLVVDQETGSKFYSWGANRFYMPHGISVDAEGNVWVTDVALHQVFRFSRQSHDSPDVVLGEPFVPGSDNKHFCKPTDVAVSSSGVVYISDGYCNSRIVMVSPSGKVMGTIQVADGQDVPHSLTLLEKDDLICVADREYRRIACYTAGLTADSQPGRLVFDLRHPDLGRVFAIDHIDDILFAVNGPDAETDRPVGVAIDLASEQVLAAFAPKTGFFNPHDVAVSPDAKNLFVSEIDLRAPKKVVKFRVDMI